MQQIKRWLPTLAAAVLVFTVTPQADAGFDDATLHLDPVSGLVGTTADVDGTGYTPGVTVEIRWGAPTG